MSVDMSNTSVLLPTSLRDAADVEARRRGWSRTQYMRYLLARDLGLEPPVPFEGLRQPRGSSGAGDDL